MKTKLIEMLLGALLSLLTPDLLRDFAKMAIQWTRDKIADTATTLDDKIAGPILDTIEEAFDLDDDI